MAITLTTNWQNVASGSFVPGTGLSITFYLDAKYSTQSQPNNTTTVQTKLRSVINSGYGSGYNYSFSCSYAPTVSGSGLWTLETETITSGENTITHNVDGTKTISLSANARINGIGMNISFSGDAILPKIDRYPLLLTAPDFSDEDDPTITYTTTLGFEGATVEAGIFDSTGTTPYVSYRAVNVENGSYTFELTNEERTTLQNATPNSNTMNVMFKLRTTTTDNVEYFSTSVKQLRIINANPTYTHAEEELNSKVITLLGSSADTIIQNASTLRITITPTAYKGASIDRVKLTSLDYEETINTSPYVFEVPMKQQNCAGVIVDTRTNGLSFGIVKNMIEYQPVDITSFSFKRVNPTSANILVSLEAKYYQETFGSTANVPVVKWKLDDGSYTTIPSSAYTIDTTNHKLTITNYQLTNVLDYRQQGQFALYIEDLLTTDTEGGENGKVLKGIPTFDAGEHDFKVNGDLFVADQDAQNKVNILESLLALKPKKYTITQATNKFTIDNLNIDEDTMLRITVIPINTSSSTTIQLGIQINDITSYNSTQTRLYAGGSATGQAGITAGGDYLVTSGSNMINIIETNFDYSRGQAELYIENGKLCISANGYRTKSGGQRVVYSGIAYSTSISSINKISFIMSDNGNIPIGTKIILEII